MKRILVFTFILIGFRANSQALIWEDDFESYTVDELLEPQSDDWYGWGGTTDTWVSDDYALNGTKSMLVSNMGSGTDVLHDFNITSGHWKIVVNAFYKSGQGGYFNILNSISPLNWSLEFFIGSEETYDGSGAGLFRNDPPVRESDIPLLPEQWVRFEMDIDIDNDILVITADGDEIYSGSWTDEDGPYTDIKSLNLVSGTTDEAPTAYFDDIQLWDMDSLNVGINNNEKEIELSLKVSNNEPSVTVFCENVIEQVDVYDLTGKLVLSSSEISNGDIINTASFNSGLFIFKFRLDKGIVSKKVIL